jgi:hypothetical protein
MAKTPHFLIVAGTSNCAGFAPCPGQRRQPQGRRHGDDGDDPRSSSSLKPVPRQLAPRLARPATRNRAGFLPVISRRHAFICGVIHTTTPSVKDNIPEYLQREHLIFSAHADALSSGSPFSGVGDAGAALIRFIQRSWRTDKPLSREIHSLAAPEGMRCPAAWPRGSLRVACGWLQGSLRVASG